MLSKYFLPYFQMTRALENQRKLSDLRVLISVEAGWRGWWGFHTANWLFSFTSFIPPHRGRGFISLFLSPLESLCIKRKIFNDKPRLQVPCKGWRPARTAAAPAPAPAPSTGMMGWKDACLRSPAPPPLPSPAHPLVATSSFIYFLLYELFLNHLSCLCTGFLRRIAQCNEQVLSGCVGGTGGRKDVEKSPLNK